MLTRQVLYSLTHASRLVCVCVCVCVCVIVFFEKGLTNYLPRLASNRNPPDLCLLSS
jgi:hypothetical protein